MKIKAVLFENRLFLIFNLFCQSQLFKGNRERGNQKRFSFHNWNNEHSHKKS